MTEKYNRTFIAIDYGERRIGVAKSDAMGIIASALTTLEVKSHAEALDKLKVILEEYEPNALVVGYPLLRSGEKSKKCIAVDEFIEKLKEIYGGTIYKVDEHASSQEAVSLIHAHGKKSGTDKRRIDRLAAVIILERFLAEHPG
ncbi:MAG: Holliday junction resolvase RuvX [Calditrichaeota bacterium]|nr:MAG: Holliday junction resolvase RuvX [Calditrichota bacterium]